MLDHGGLTHTVVANIFQENLSRLFDCQSSNFGESTLDRFPFLRDGGEGLRQFCLACVDRFVLLVEPNFAVIDVLEFALECFLNFLSSDLTLLHTLQSEFHFAVDFASSLRRLFLSSKLNVFGTITCRGLCASDHFFGLLFGSSKTSACVQADCDAAANESEK